MHTPKDSIRHPLYVITCIFNPARYRRRWELYRKFQKHVRDSGAILLTVEAALGERSFALEEHADPRNAVDGSQYKSFGPPEVPPCASLPNSRIYQDYIKLRVQADQEIWLKENMLNIGLHHLPPDAKYVAFIDADITFTRQDWVSETLHALQQYPVVQMFSAAINMSPEHFPLVTNLGYAYCHHHGYPRNTLGTHFTPGTKSKPNTWHTGFAWAWRLTELDQVGGLIEHGILGAGDNHMARALVGRHEESLNPALSEGYKRQVRKWAALADRYVQGNVGYVEGSIAHAWHGSIRNRRYGDRWKILIDHQFDPDIDLGKDSRGVLRMLGKLRLQQDIRRYMYARLEDSIDVPERDYQILEPRPDWTPTRKP